MQAAPMKTRIFTFALLSLLWSSSTRPAQAVPVFFFNSPATNSADWSASLAGATINTNVNFNSHPLGALNGSFYNVSDGVTLTGSGFGLAWSTARAQETPTMLPALLIAAKVCTRPRTSSRPLRVLFQTLRYPSATRWPGPASLLLISSVRPALVRPG